MESSARAGAPPHQRRAIAPNPVRAQQMIDARPRQAPLRRRRRRRRQQGPEPRLIGPGAQREEVATGRVAAGKVILEGQPLSEGSVVTVLAQEADETFDVTPEEERALLAAMAEAERGEVVSWNDVLERLQRLG
ncbi:MAG: hypothetical protein ACRD2X_03990 [Vicinamibacteraceae bacterium]